MILYTYLEINNTFLYFPANVEFQNQTRKPLKLLPHGLDLTPHFPPYGQFLCKFIFFLFPFLLKG